MPREEAKYWARGSRKASFYQDALKVGQEEKKRDKQLKKVLTPEEMPWDNCPQGRIKHLVNEGMDARLKTVDAYIQELPPGSWSGKHRHTADEVLFILEGKGYDLHWDVEAMIKDRYDWKVATESTKWEWEEGDCVYIPVNTVHQHFNADPDRPARFISAVSRVYKYIGYNDLEQIENAPEWSGG